MTYWYKFKIRDRVSFFTFSNKRIRFWRTCLVNWIADRTKREAPSTNIPCISTKKKQVPRVKMLVKMIKPLFFLQLQIQTKVFFFVCMNTYMQVISGKIIESKNSKAWWWECSAVGIYSCFRNFWLFFLLKSHRGPKSTLGCRSLKI